MKIDGQHYTSIWYDEKSKSVKIIDQTLLPFEFKILELKSLEDAFDAIKNMWVRGAPLIGATAAWGMYLAALEKNTDDTITQATDYLNSARPTAIDLFKATERQQRSIIQAPANLKIATAKENAALLSSESIFQCRSIGEHGLKIIKNILEKKKDNSVNILTHCNAGWLATVDYGTATAPIYLAHDAGIKVHVWVDETRPRNQGASLTAYELGHHGVPHTVIADNTGGHLMQHGMVDMVIVGTDRTTRTGDVANKIGTYLKALAAYDNQVPFYVAAPSSSIDFSLTDGLKQIPIETRSENEVKYMRGLGAHGTENVLITPPDSPALNYGFDVTPARLVTGIITERGICNANEKSILQLFPEHKI